MSFLFDKVEYRLFALESGLLSLILYAAIICSAAGRKYLYAINLLIFLVWVRIGAPAVNSASGEVLDYVNGSESNINLLSIERRS